MSTEVIRAPRIEIRDEGTPQGRVTTINFTGSGVSASVSGNVANISVSGGSGSGNSVTSTLSFGANFTDKATTVVTGQAWVGASSCIIPQVLTPSGTDPDEMYLLDLEPTISDLVAGVGFTITLYSQAEARGDYSVMCIGV